MCIIYIIYVHNIQVTNIMLPTENTRYVHCTIPIHYNLLAYIHLLYALVYHVARFISVYHVTHTPVTFYVYIVYCTMYNVQRTIRVF